MMSWICAPSLNGNWPPRLFKLAKSVKNHSRKLPAAPERTDEMNSRGTLQSEELQRAARTLNMAHTVAAQNGGAHVQVYTYIYSTRRFIAS